MFCSPGQSRLVTVFAGLAFLALGGCSRTPQRDAERVAVLPFENLTSDSSLDWLGRAISNAVAAQAAGESGWRAFESPGLREAQDARATQVVHGYITGGNRGLRVHAVLRDEPARRNVRTLVESGLPAQVLDIAARLARHLAPAVRDYTTKEAGAVRALFTGNPKEAIAADPQYGQAHLELAQQFARAGDRDAFKRALESAAGARLTDADRARVGLLLAQESGDAQARLAALQRAVESSPPSPQLWRALAEAQVQGRKYADAAVSYSRVLELSPGDQAALNSRGYARMFAGDFAGAVESLEEYRRVAPDAANALDSLGEVHYWFGRYAEAARLFTEAHQKDPRTLGGFEPFRAALALYLSGDSARADKDFETFAAARAKAGDPAAASYHMNWLRLTGRKPPAPGPSSIEQSTAALWALYEGDRGRARSFAEAARRSATLPPVVNLAATMLFLTEPSADANTWTARVEKALPRPEQSGVRTQLLALALLLDGKFPDAARVWRDLHDAAPAFGSNDAAIALEWALRAAGDERGAAAVAPAGIVPPQAVQPSALIVVHAKAIELHARKS